MTLARSIRQYGGGEGEEACSVLMAKLMQAVATFPLNTLQTMNPMSG